jgi:hypothetical protein
MYTQRQTWSYAHLHVEHGGNRETTLWTFGEEGKKKRMIESQYQTTSHLYR